MYFKTTQRLNGGKYSAYKQSFCSEDLGKRRSCPSLEEKPFRLEIDGTPRLFPGTGGITYNFALGDSAFKMVGDHVEPDVSTKNPDNDKNAAYVGYSCIGNSATLISGDAKREKGIVIGKHGGINHVLIHFKEDIKEEDGDWRQDTGCRIRPGIGA